MTGPRGERWACRLTGPEGDGQKSLHGGILQQPRRLRWSPPFCARGRAVRLPVGGVDPRPVDTVAIARRGGDALPTEPLLAPAIEPVLDRRVRPPGCGGHSRDCAPLCGLGTIPQITRRSSTRRTPFRPPGKAVRCEPPPLPSATRPVRHPKAHPSSPETATGRKRRALVRAEPASIVVTGDPRPVGGRPGPRGPAASDPAGPRAVRRRARHVRRARPRPPGASARHLPA